MGATLEQMGLVQGTREEIKRELDRLGEDATRLGRADKAYTYARALSNIEDGDDTVIVHHVRYDVVE